MLDAPKAELLRSLGKIVRGLSALFWGLPLTLIAYVQTARTNWLSFLGGFAFIPVVLLSLVICYALLQMRQFQKQERIWQNALRRAELYALINAGLAPFLFWWHRLPFVPLYGASVAMLGISSLLLLIQINRVLQRLTSMLPDEALRSETYMFSSLNTTILGVVLFLVGLYLGFQQLTSPPRIVHDLLTLANYEGLWVMMFLVLMPLAMTMAMSWKIKEVIFSSVFNAER
jgi:hypothetical protein